ncbi:periodic tryptophan protein 1 homolog [Teleopsis dalmanni]|uniref:periodic tryptophan protein 1 homolog n=1 Tax=Teleopsis dalmanni TaxID=139649 RepID=UPI0018CFEE4E|nr:periodic tryptophan protein 1 homolog [Teleopsis dalmanni]
MDGDAPQEPTIDFVPALCFVPRGVTKERPEKVALSRNELEKIIKDAKEQLGGGDGDGDNDDNDTDDENNANNMDVDDVRNTNENNDPNDEFNFDNYEQEEQGNLASIATIVNADQQIADEDNDSEAEDEIIKSTDNLILVGHVQDDAASMEVWVFNQDEESLYTHHDFLLPSFPLCIEWMNHDPGSSSAGNLCAIGCMDPVITVWDLDIQDSLEPAFKLGSKGSRKKNKPRIGHMDAVLDLSWNREYEHIIASGSVDKTLILWDLDEGEPHTTITAFKNKVQSVEFHGTEAQTLLTGCADGLVRIFDCRDPEIINTSFIKWKINGEVEKVLWHPTETHNFIIGTNDGSLHYADKRRPDSFLWSLKAHEEEISGVCFNAQKPNLLTTSSTDGVLKVWNFSTSKIDEVHSHDFEMGRLQCMKQCPEDPYTLALGGEKPPRCRIYNIKNFETVRRVFDIPDAI